MPTLKTKRRCAMQRPARRHCRLPRWVAQWVLAAATSLLLGCGGGSQSAPPTSQTPSAGTAPPVVTIPPANQPLPDNRGKNPLQVLWFGNSHTSAHNLPDLVRQLLKAGAGIEASMAVLADGAYLDERWHRAADQQRLLGNNWQMVILQAQKYSMSGTVSYSTLEAQYWVDLAKSRQIMPVLYPEHPQAGNFSEGSRVQQLHQSIANASAACVAPVGLVWDLQIQRQPGLRLHEPDDNHANPTGVLLTAYVFYQVLSGKSALSVPDLPALPVPPATQQQLRQSAADLLAQQPACPFS